jgi:hypothetical protein
MVYQNFALWDPVHVIISPFPSVLSLFTLSGFSNFHV